MYIPLPDLDSRRSIFGANLRKSPVAPDVDLDLLARATQGFSGADITEICQRAAKNAIRESIAAEMEKAMAVEKGEITEEEAANVDAVPYISREHFEEAMSHARKSVSDEEIQRYDTYSAHLKNERGAKAGFSFDDLEKAEGDAEDDGMYAEQ